MACRGVLFAIDDDVVQAILDAGDDEAVMAVVEEVEDAWNEDRLAETDKAWDAMHRALSDGTLDPTGGEAPLNLAILGGNHLHSGEDYIVALVSKEKVPEVARALAAIDEAHFRERYFRLVPADYAPEFGEEDFAYTWSNLREVATLYARAAQEGLSVIFTVDQ